MDGRGVGWSEAGPSGAFDDAAPEEGVRGSRVHHLPLCSLTQVRQNLPAWVELPGMIQTLLGGDSGPFTCEAYGGVDRRVAGLAKRESRRDALTCTPDPLPHPRRGW